MLMKQIILSTLLLLAHSAWSQGQDPVTFKFRALALDRPIREGLYTQAEGGEPIYLYTNSKTDMITYVGENPVVFYLETRSETGPATRRKVAQFDVNTAPQSALLLFNRARSGAFEYKVNAINDSEEVAPAGSYRIFNFTDKEIAGMIGEKTFHTPASESALAVIPKSGAFPIFVRLAERGEGGQPELLYSASWRFSSEARYLILIFPDPDPTRGNIKIRKIADLL